MRDHTQASVLRLKLCLFLALGFLATYAVAQSSLALRYNYPYMLKHVPTGYFVYIDSNAGSKPMRADYLTQSASIFSLTGNSDPVITSNSYIRWKSVPAILNGGLNQWCLAASRPGYTNPANAFCSFGVNLSSFQLVKRIDVDPLNDEYIWSGSYVSFNNTVRGAWCGIDPSVSTIVSCDFPALGNGWGANATLFQIFF